MELHATATKIRGRLAALRKFIAVPVRQQPNELPLSCGRAAAGRRG